MARSSFQTRFNHRNSQRCSFTTELGKVWNGLDMFASKEQADCNYIASIAYLPLDYFRRSGPDLII